MQFWFLWANKKNSLVSESSLIKSSEFLHLLIFSLNFLAIELRATSTFIGIDIVIKLTYYPAQWQRVSGDPHGQVAEEEKPDPLGDETLSFDFPETGAHGLVLWDYPTHG